MHGVPVAVKDMFALPWRAPRDGCTRNLFGVEAGESAVYRRLRDAGAVIVAVTNMHELGSGLDRSHLGLRPVRDTLGSVTVRRRLLRRLGIVGRRPARGRRRRHGRRRLDPVSRRLLRRHRPQVHLGPGASGRLHARLLVDGRSGADVPGRRGRAPFGRRPARAPADGAARDHAARGRRAVVLAEHRPRGGGSLPGGARRALGQRRRDARGRARRSRARDHRDGHARSRSRAFRRSSPSWSPRSLLTSPPWGGRSPNTTCSCPARQRSGWIACVHSSGGRLPERSRTSTCSPGRPCPRPRRRSRIPPVELPSGRVPADYANVRQGGIGNLSGVPALSVPCGLTSDRLPIGAAAARAVGRGRAAARRGGTARAGHGPAPRGRRPPDRGTHTGLATCSGR